MKKFILGAVVLSAASLSFADFFPMDSLVLTRANAATSSNVGASVDLVGFNYAGTANGQVFGLATAGNNFVLSSSATSEGFMNGSANLLAIGGYNATAGSATPNTTTGARRVAVFSNAGIGSVSYVDLPSGVYSGSNVRSAYTTDGTTVLTGGTSSANNGWRSTTAGVSDQLGTTTNTRIIKQVGGTIYGSTGSATGNGGVGIYSLVGGVETLVQATTGTGTGTASPYDFEFYNEGASSFLMIADDRSVLNGGGLQIFQGGSLVKTFGQASLRSIAVRNWVDAGVPKTSIFGISNLNTLVGVTFNQGELLTTTATFSTLATAATGSTFRSIEVVPEPASMIALGLGAAAMLRRRKKS